MRTRRSSILVFTLWVLVFLSVFSLGIGRKTSGNLMVSRYFKNRLITYYLAKAGIEMGIYELDKDETPFYDTLNEFWANNDKIFKDIPLGLGCITLSYTLPISGSLLENNNQGEAIGKQPVFYGIMDESNKININKVPVKVLKNLLINLGKVDEKSANDIASSIVDWRDRDVIVSQGGAENNYYQSLKMPYKCKNRSFEVLEELLLVKGVSFEIFSKIKDVITVYGQDKVNVNTSSWQVLYGIGFSEYLSKRIVDFRKGEDGVDGTEDDRVFKTAGGIRGIGALFTEESLEINSYIGFLDVKTNTVRIKSQGMIKIENKIKSQAVITCVVSRADKKEYEFLYWHEN